MAHALTTQVDGQKIRLARERADLTVDELVAELRKEGVIRHPDTIRNVELGYSQPGMKLFNAIVRVLNRFGAEREDLLADPQPAEEAS
jgi:transcriptional regulator with XRE-family HTH domain